MPPNPHNNCGGLKTWPPNSLTLFPMIGGGLCPLPLSLGSVAAWPKEYGGNDAVPVSGTRS